jgi:hypothetical protein
MFTFFDTWFFFGNKALWSTCENNINHGKKNRLAQMLDMQNPTS